MKKMALVCTAALAAVLVFTMPAGQSTVNGANVVMAASTNNRFDNADYAVMAFLQFSKQQVSDVQDGSIQLSKSGSDYTLSDDNNQFEIEVAKQQVVIKSTDQHNAVKKHAYSKAKLQKKFKGQAAAIKAKLKGQNDQNN